MRLLALGGLEAAIAQRYIDVVEDVEVGNQVEALEHKPDLFVAQARAGIVAQTRHILTVECVAAAVEGLQ